MLGSKSRCARNLKPAVHARKRLTDCLRLEGVPCLPSKPSSMELSYLS